MREIVVDTETTGLAVSNGHRLVEIACIELEMSKPTGRMFHRYIFPMVSAMPEEAFRIHGIGIEFLKRHPPFLAIADDLLAFFGTAPLVMHNAAFDLGFINAELERCGRRPISPPRVDTLDMARKMFPGVPNSLDALCRRYGIDLEVRKLHGAAIDCSLLARVYFELTGGRQPKLAGIIAPRSFANLSVPGPAGPRRWPRPHPPLTVEEQANFAETMARITAPIWHGFRPAGLDDEIPF